MSTELWSYVAGGAGNEFTQELNVSAFQVHIHVNHLIYRAR